MIVDKTYGHAAYGCAECCGWGTAPWMYYDPIGVGLGLGADQDVWDTDFCTLQQSSVLDVIVGSSWNTANHAIATASRAVITGVGVGSTTNSASGTLTVGGMESKRCPPDVLYPSGATNVGPTVTGISPAQGIVGTAISVTITGTGFASGATVNAGAKISVSNVNVASSTQITATFTPSNSTSAGGNQGITVTVSGQPSNSQNFFVQYPLHLYYVNTSITPNNGHSAIVSGTNITIIEANGQTPPNGTGVCGGYQWISYGAEDQNGNGIENGTVTFTESFSNISPSPDPFGNPNAQSSTVNLASYDLGDTYALWNPSPPACEPASASDSFNQQWTATVGTVAYPLATVIFISRSTNSQGIPTFSSSITTP